MKHLIAAAAMLLAAPAFAAPVTLESDPAHSTAGFAVKHMMFTTVRGTFNKFTSSLVWDDADPTKSTVSAKIDAASIDTHQEARDNHLRSPEFFDVKKCPDLTFKSNKVEKSSGDAYNVTGDLTMHCVTKPVTLEVHTDGKPHVTPFGSTIYTVGATTKLKRSDFGLTWNKAVEGGGVIVSDEVDLELSLEYAAPKAVATEAKGEGKDAAKHGGKKHADKPAAEAK